MENPEEVLNQRKAEQNEVIKVAHFPTTTTTTTTTATFLRRTMLRSCSSLKSIATKPSTKPSSLHFSSSAPALQSLNSSNHNEQDQDQDHHSSSPTSSPDNSNSNSSLSLTREYDLVVQADSYTEIHNKLVVHHHHHHHHNIENNNSSSSSGVVVASPPLRPNRNSVDSALSGAPPTKLTRLVSTYFDHSESASELLCSLLHRSLHSARSLYSPIHAFLSVLDPDPLDLDLDLRLSPAQCDALLDLFRRFLDRPNPFPSPSPPLPLPLLLRPIPLRHPPLPLRPPPPARPPPPPRPIPIPLPRFRRALRRQLQHIAQLDAAAVGAYVVNIELDTINCLVEKLYDAVESDRFLVRFGAERGGRDNRYPIQEVVKQLRKNMASLKKQMEDLEVHVCICLASVNRARSRLLEEIHRQQM
ncbi:hypothetical protein Sjap_017715 [Stephania japonica]|uniref:Uncharacterized protein n=1 Tax=Stephania japonica TaxID=461633 RepID=A0AAP0I6P6_9MAGN